MQKASDRTNPSHLLIRFSTIPYIGQDDSGLTDAEFVYDIGDRNEIFHGRDNIGIVFAV